MIRTIRDPETARVWAGERSRRLPPDIQDTALRKLRILNRADRLDDLRAPPGNRLEALRGDRQGQHSITLVDRWRMVVTFRDDALTVVRIEEVSAHYGD